MKILLSFNQPTKRSFVHSISHSFIHSVNSLLLATVGAPPMPGRASNLTRAMSFILPGTFPQQAYLTHFMVFFVRPDPVYLQIWTLNVTGVYTLKYSQKVVPAGYNTAQTVRGMYGWNWSGWGVQTRGYRNLGQKQRIIDMKWGKQCG